MRERMGVKEERRQLRRWEGGDKTKYENTWRNEGGVMPSKQEMGGKDVTMENKTKRKCAVEKKKKKRFLSQVLVQFPAGTTLF